jgi:hypothetical protein
VTRKSFIKSQRRSSAAQNWRAAQGAADISILEIRSAPLRMATDGSASRRGRGAAYDAETTKSESNKEPATNKPAAMPARCAIVAAAFHEATSANIRQKLKGKSPLAIIVLVPEQSWIEPVRALFVDKFGPQWQRVLEADAKTTLQHKIEWNNDVATYLAHGQPVLGVAVNCEALPSILIGAADLTIRMRNPRNVTIRRAIRMFTGKSAPTEIDDDIAFGLSFPDLIAAFRANSTAEEIIDRLRKASPARSSTTERLPMLEEAVEYGDARNWGLTLVRDLADYRAGRITWQEVDRGAVLFSEPGLGKTLFARILAQACGVPLVAFSIADLFANSPGHLDSVIKSSRAMFERAAALAPCILFLDELDALPNRATMSPRGADWWTPVITDFLLSLDSAVAGQRSGVVVIGATNNVEGIDAALLPPGRLERTIEIVRPDHAGAANILRYHLNGELPGADLTDVARLMDGSTGAEIMMTVRGARRIARFAGRKLECGDLLQSMAPMEAIAPAALNRICIHEAGHAVGSLVLGSGVLKRCVIRSAAATAGHTLIWADEGDLLTRESVERYGVVLLCGRAAERLLIGNAGLGAGGDDESDLARVTQLVATLHASSGLGDTLTYITSFKESLSNVRINRELRSKVEQHIRILHRRADEVVHEHCNAILIVAEQLKARRQLSGEEVRRISNATSLKDGRTATNH